MRICAAVAMCQRVAAEVLGVRWRGEVEAGLVASSSSIGKRSLIMQISVTNVEAPMTVQGLRPTKWPHL